jgi:hypothetical protein
MSWERAAKFIATFGIQGLKHVDSRTHAATTGWGVSWDEASIARDIMQNFYDANRDNLAEVVVCSKGRVVQISAPSRHDLDLLFYLASTKGPDDVGQYGEGFKAAVTCLLRDHRVTPIARSGERVLCIQLADTPVRDTDHYPLIYHFFECESVVENTVLILPDCSKKLVTELEKGLTHFFFDANPLLAGKSWQSYDGSFLIYSTSGTTGHVFYRNLKRGEIDGLPIVLVINKEYKVIENRIKSDRDRKAFGEELMDLFYHTFCKYAFPYSHDGQRIIIEAARHRWVKGHPLLSAVARNVSYRSRLFSDEVAREIFGNGYFARSTSRDPLKQTVYDRLEAEWQRAGKQALPGYFERFGVLSAERYCEQQEEKAKRESIAKGKRGPTRGERESIEILRGLLGDLAPELKSLFESRSTTYTIAETEVVLGTLRDGRGFRSSDVFLAAKLFTGPFSTAVAVFLHEHAHIFGYDGSRGFTDALTELIETIIAVRSDLDSYETEWEKARRTVSKERKSRTKLTDDDGPEGKLVAMSEDDLRKLLSRVPRGVLKRLLESAEESDADSF